MPSCKNSALDMGFLAGNLLECIGFTVFKSVGNYHLQIYQIAGHRHESGQYCSYTKKIVYFLNRHVDARKPNQGPAPFWNREFIDGSFSISVRQDGQRTKT